MLIRCPSCSGGFELADDALGVKATTVCPSCARVVVVRDARLVPPGKKEGTIPFDPGTEAAVDPVPAAEEPTAVGAAGALLGLPKATRVSVAIVSGERKGHVVRLDRPRVVFGRSGGGAEIQLPDVEMSRTHAALECRGSRITLRDLGSRNGTFVGEDRIQSRELDDGSEFRMGRTRLVLVLSEKAC